MLKKSAKYGLILAPILKQCVGNYLPYLTVSINYSLKENTLPEQLKPSEVISLYQKLDPPRKENYKPVSLLHHVSKIFERILLGKNCPYSELF